MRRGRIRALVFAIALAVALVLATLPARAAFEDAVRLLEQEHYERAHRLLARLAAEGDAQAQDALAALYVKGVGVERDVGKAMQWYCRLAHQPAGGPAVMRAAWYLAEYFRTGGGTPESQYAGAVPEREDPIRAFFWFGVMARQGELYDEVHLESKRLGKMGLGTVGRNLYESERARVEEALSHWRAAREHVSGERCLRLPDGLSETN